MSPDRHEKTETACGDGNVTRQRGRHEETEMSRSDWDVTVGRGSYEQGQRSREDTEVPRRRRPHELTRARKDLLKPFGDKKRPALTSLGDADVVSVSCRPRRSRMNERQPT